MPGPSFIPGQRRGPETSSTRDTPQPTKDGAPNARTPLDAKLRAATFDEGAALLSVPSEEKTSEGPPAYPQPDASTRNPHERRMALHQARNGLHLKLQALVTEQYLREQTALTSFEETMTFAHGETVLGLVLGEVFGTLVKALPAPISEVAATVALFTGAFEKAGAASDGAALHVWIQRHRDALEQVRATRVDALQQPELACVDAEIERLVADDTVAGALRSEAWERAMSDAAFKLDLSAIDLELQLYDAWCFTTGAYFVANLFRNDARFPGDEAPGHTDQGHRAFGGRQVTAPHLPAQILDRLKTLGLDPLATLNLPRELHHNERVTPGRDDWRHTQTTYDMPHDGQRRRDWPGPERFKQP